MKSVIRCFIALEISSQVKTEIEKTLKKLAPRTTSLKWVHPSQYHLTLKFLGDIPMNELHTVLRAVEKGCQETELFDLCFERFGAFPNIDAPHTLWVGLSEGIDESRQLARAIEERLFEVGYPRDHRPFTPHLTVGRIRKGEENDYEKVRDFIAEEGEHLFGLSEVDAVTVFSSELSRSGPRYEVLAEIDLKKGSF